MIPNFIRNYIAILITLTVAITLTIVRGSCPNLCSHHGLCNKFSRCECADGFQGADCSEKICPFAAAWADEATDTDVAHNPAECSNKGICNRKSGKCMCMAGFTGAACERLACHLDCNGNGVCSTMKDLAAKTRDEQSRSFTYTDVWDADKIAGCQCDSPMAGYDCSQQLCPSGDDPLTTGQVNEIQLLRCIATQGAFTLFYNGRPSARIPHTATATQVKEALLVISGLTDLKVTFSQITGRVCQLKANVVSIEFTEQFGPQNPLVPVLDSVLTANGGSVAISADGFRVFTDNSGRSFRSRKGTKESDICSNRGLCSLSDGVCECFETYGDVYASSDGYGNPGTRGDCGYVLSATETTVSTCPGEIPCSGHGVCDDDENGSGTFRCSCSEGWSGGDCSEKECPLGLTWFGYPSGNNEAHNDYVVCSNMGICDKIRGKCQCRENFYGQACEYMTCGGGLGNPCNGHGRCMSMAELALWAEENGDATERVYGSDPNNIDTWDYDRVHGCLCDEGYSGYDCSLIDCPVGDDPGTYEDHVEVQLLQCYGNSGNFTLSFRQKETEILSHNVTADELQAALSALSSIKNVSVYFIKDGLPPNGTLNYVAPVRAKVAGFPPWAFINATGANLIYLPVTPLIRRSNSTFCSTDGTQIAIISFDYTHGDLPAIIPSTRFLEDFINANGEPGTGVINVFQDGASVYSLESIKGTTEVDVCNNRGLCDTSTGLCNCFDDWTSSDGARQGGAGNTRDCGYRNDRLFSYFKSDL